MTTRYQTGLLACFWSIYKVLRRGIVTGREDRDHTLSGENTSDKAGYFQLFLLFFNWQSIVTDLYFWRLFQTFRAKCVDCCYLVLQ